MLRMVLFSSSLVTLGFLVTFGQSVVITSTQRPGARQCSCIPPENCIPHPFVPYSDLNFKCPSPSHVCCAPNSIREGTTACSCERAAGCSSAVSGKCANQAEVCCAPASGSPVQSPPVTSSPVTPDSETGLDCSTPGTPNGKCVNYSDCNDVLYEAERRLSTFEFVNLYGCGVSSTGRFRLCCPAL